jgi:hypothetical protein
LERLREINPSRILMACIRCSASELLTVNHSPKDAAFSYVSGGKTAATFTSAGDTMIDLA